MLLYSHHPIFLGLDVVVVVAVVAVAVVVVAVVVVAVVVVVVVVVDFDALVASSVADCVICYTVAVANVADVDPDAFAVAFASPVLSKQARRPLLLAHSIDSISSSSSSSGSSSSSSDNSKSNISNSSSNSSSSSSISYSTKLAFIHYVVLRTFSGWHIGSTAVSCNRSFAVAAAAAVADVLRHHFVTVLLLLLLLTSAYC